MIGFFVKIVLLFVSLVAFCAEVEQEKNVAAAASSSSSLSVLIKQEELRISSSELKKICDQEQDDQVLMRFNQKIILYLLPRISLNDKDVFDVPSSVCPAFRELATFFWGTTRTSMESTINFAGCFNHFMCSISPLRQEKPFYTHREYGYMNLFLNDIATSRYIFPEDMAFFRCSNMLFLKDAAHKLVDTVSLVSLHQPRIPQKNMKPIVLAYAMIFYNAIKNQPIAERYLESVKSRDFLFHLDMETPLMKYTQSYFDLFNKIVITDVQKETGRLEWGSEEK